MVDVGAYESNAATSQTTIISVPIETATVGVLYEYDVDTGVVAAGTRVEKDRGACGTFSFVTNPAGMTIDGVTGEIAWTPGGGQTGAQAVTVRFVDPDGPTNVTQGFTIQVTAP
jgi:hypothetical protein